MTEDAADRTTDGRRVPGPSRRRLGRRALALGGALALAPFPAGPASAAPRTTHRTLRHGSPERAGLLPAPLRRLVTDAETFLGPSPDHPWYAGAVLLAGRGGTVLAELDWVQASVHGGQRMPRRELTARVEAALRHPAVRCLSHPLGRIIGRRPENALDLERVFEVAREHDVALEVNGLAARLDLSGEHVREALAAGVRIVCSTDAHSVRGLANMPLSVHTARRGGATRADVANAAPLVDLIRGRSA